VPRPIRLATPLSRPVLACGALLKNTFCLARGEEAVLGPHIGDLENLETFTSYRDSIDRLERFLGFEPEVIAHDLHPDYLSTRYALGRTGTVRVAVQHHHAHVASVMAEHGLEGPVIGVAYDGTGLGTDGTAWGGEILLARYDGFERLATFRPIARWALSASNGRARLSKDRLRSTGTRSPTPTSRADIDTTSCDRVPCGRWICARRFATPCSS
jgi:hydrogenase maturation protein HypF